MSTTNMPFQISEAKPITILKGNLIISKLKDYNMQYMSFSIYFREKRIIVVYGTPFIIYFPLTQIYPSKGQRSSDMAPN